MGATALQCFCGYSEVPPVDETLSVVGLARCNGTVYNMTDEINMAKTQKDLND